ncbi:hypothetical protein ASE49_08210 [Novosphingobium sp. Leaf2]|nr:hypothetical protein ASE49_08210 [Novosphingobium sp. Leaf2]
MTKHVKIALNVSRDIPFSQLVLSQANVRRVKAGVSIDLAHNQSPFGHTEIAPVEGRGTMGHEQEKLATAQPHAAAPCRHGAPAGIGRAPLGQPFAVDEDLAAKRADFVACRRRDALHQRHMGQVRPTLELRRRIGTATDTSSAATDPRMIA